MGALFEANISDDDASLVFSAGVVAGLAVVEMGLHDDSCSALEDFVKTDGDELVRPFVFV